MYRWVINMENKKLKEQCIQLFLEGKRYSEIAEKTGFSRTFITNLIKDDPRVMEEKNKKKLKVFKRKDNNQMTVYIPTSYLKKIGISSDKDKSEYVDIYLKEQDKTIILKKHK